MSFYACLLVVASVAIRVAAVEQDVANVNELRMAMDSKGVETVKVTQDLIFDDSVTFMHDKLEALTPLIKDFLSVIGDCVDESGQPRYCDVDANQRPIRIFMVLGDNTGASLTLQNLIFHNAIGQHPGGAVVRGIKGVMINISNCILHHNMADVSGGKGGALHLDAGAILTVADTIFHDNIAAQAGAIFADESTFTHCKFFNNTALGKIKGGGALYMHDSTTKIIDCEFEGNKAQGPGDDVYRRCPWSSLQVWPFPSDIQANSCSSSVIMPVEDMPSQDEPVNPSSEAPTPSLQPPPSPVQPNEEQCLVSGQVTKFVSCDLDATGDGTVNVLDVTAIINIVLGTGGDPTVPAGEEGCQITMGMIANCDFDTSKDGVVNVQDAVIILNEIL